MEGIFQKVIRVDLTNKLTGEEQLPIAWYRERIGALGIGISYLGEDLLLKRPLLDDPLLIMCGPLTGYPVIGASKAAVISYHSKSGRLRLGSLVGHFPAYLRFAGYDGLILTGKSEEPVTLHLGGRSRLTGTVDERSDNVPGHGGEGSFFEFDAEKEWAGWAGELSSKKVKRFLLEPDGELPFPSDSGRLFSALSEELDTLSRGGEGRRSCFACAMACGRYEPSSQGWRLEGIKEEGALSREEAKSWARALYDLHGGYEDILFQEARSVSEWVEAENWAVIKNCLPVCGRWPMRGHSS